MLDADRRLFAAPAARRELWGWCALAIAALAVAGVYAVLMIFSRAPGSEQSFPWLLGFFKKGLVTHVVFSVVVWFVAVMAALMQLATARLAGEEGRTVAGGLGRAGLLLAVAAFPCLFVPAFLEGALPSLNNYVPVLMHPLYYAGLALLALGIGASALRLVVNALVYTRDDVWAVAVVRAALVFFLALACFGIARALLAGQPVSEGFFEVLFWGGGHLLQFANTLLVVGAWYLLGRTSFGRPLVGELTMQVATWVLLLSALVAPAFYLAFDRFSGAQHQAFSNLQLALAPWTMLVAGASLAAMRGQSRPWREPAFHALLLSIVVFGLGGAFGMFADGKDTRTPAHYHGMIGGVTLAFIGVFYGVLLPLLKREPRAKRLVVAQLWLYAVGQALQCAGLFIAAAPRKTAGAEQALLTAAQAFGMRLNHGGGGLAILGGMLFVAISAAALLRRRRGA